MNALRLSLCALAVSILVTPVALADDADADLLDWALGEWTGTRTDAADGSVAPMRMLVEALPGGFGQVARLEVTSDAVPYVGFIVRLPDLETGQWSMVYANNARMKFARLRAASTGEPMTWISETAVPPRRSRLTEERLDGDRWRRTQEISSDDGASWRVLFVDDLERGSAFVDRAVEPENGDPATRETATLDDNRAAGVGRHLDLGGDRAGRVEDATPSDQPR